MIFAWFISPISAILSETLILYETHELRQYSLIVPPGQSFQGINNWVGPTILMTGLLDVRIGGSGLVFGT